MHLEFAVGVRFFPGTTCVVWDREFGLGVELFKQATAIVEQSLTQTQLNGLTIADPVPAQILPSQSQEGFSFLELLVGEFLGLEFFLLPESWNSI